MNYTDTQLKQALAKMLPEHIRYNYLNELVWHCKAQAPCVLDTELLHLCWMVEQELNINDLADYEQNLNNQFGYMKSYHASWQQRVVVLAKVKGVEIV